MTVLSIPGMSVPSCTSMTMSTWFKVTSFNNFLPQNPLLDAPPPTEPSSPLGLGAGAWPGGAGTPPYGTSRGSYGGGGDIAPTQSNVFRDPFDATHRTGWRSNPFPLVEWGNQLNTLHIVGGDGSLFFPLRIATSNSGIYITSDKQIVLFLGGKFYDVTSVNQAPAAGWISFNKLFLHKFYSTQVLASQAPEIDFTGWNQLITSIDVSVPDVWPHPPNEGIPDGFGDVVYADVGHRDLTQNSLISMMCNGNLHRAGFNDQESNSFTPSQSGNSQYFTCSPVTRFSQEAGGRLGGTYSSAGDSNPETELFGGTEFALPCLAASAQSYYNYATIVYAYTQVWFNKYLDLADSTITDKFFRRVVVNGQSRLKPPTDIQAAQKAFGPSDIWCYRDKRKKIQYQVNQGTAGPLTVVGSSHADYALGPGQ